MKKWTRRQILSAAKKAEVNISDVKHVLSYLDGTYDNKKTEPVDVSWEWDLDMCFFFMRHDKETHLGLGDIRLTIGEQDKICELVEKYYMRKKHDTKKRT